MRHTSKYPAGYIERDLVHESGRLQEWHNFGQPHEAADRHLEVPLIEQCFEKTTDQTIAEFVTCSRVHPQAC